MGVTQGMEVAVGSSGYVKGEVLGSSIWAASLWLQGLCSVTLEAHCKSDLWHVVWLQKNLGGVLGVAWPTVDQLALGISILMCKLGQQYLVYGGAAAAN